MPTGTAVRIRLSGDASAVRQWLDEHPADIGRATQAGDRVAFSLTVAGDLAEDLRARGFSVEVLYEIDDAYARTRIGDVGRANRFEGGRIPRGLGLRRGWIRR